MSNDLRVNLRLIAANHRSVSAFCRELGFNRQQFERYLSGKSRPSAHNLKRIADALEIPVEDLVRPHGEFVNMHARLPHPRESLPVLEPAFPGDLRKLRSLLGFYHSHFQVPGAPGVVFRSLVSLYEQDGRIMSKSIERRSNRDTMRGYISKYRGLASFLGNCIFIVEFEYLSGDSIVETILFPPYRKTLDTMTGMTFGVTSRVHRQPFSSRVMWKFLGVSVDPRQALAHCGRVALAHRALDPAVRRFFMEKEGGRVESAVPT
jgi:transcriptional regulator with XRE-family HTH domain